MEKDIQAAQSTVQPAPGLPSSSTWASGASPVSASSTAPSAWSKPLAGKVTGPPAVGSKKTLQQIQKEEEARKQRAATAVAHASAANPALAAIPVAPSGKRYADLASKHAQAAQGNPGTGGAWTTVGAGGKAKSPVVVVPTGPAATTRTAIAAVVPTVASKSKPVIAPTRRITLGGPLAGQLNAEEEFRKWAVAELRSDLNKGINGQSTA